MWLLGKLAGLWGKLPVGARGFTLGTLAGLLLSTGISLLWPRHDPSAEIARQNAVAALDSTRAYTAGHDTVYARIIAQKDVKLTGALATVAKLRGDNAKLSAKLDIVSAESRTTESHSVPVNGGDDAGDVGSSGEADVGVASSSVSDSLVLPGPPVEGRVAVKVTAQPDTTLRFDWDARLRPSPVNLEVGLGCGEDGPELTAHGPTWTHIEIQPGEVDPEVCNPSVRVGVVRRGLEVVGGVAVVVGVIKVVKSLFH